MIGKLPDFFKSPHAISGKEQSASVLLALSGGADSACLLHLLSAAKSHLGFELYAAHVNHGIRGAEYGNEADRDEAFCKDLCEKLGVELFCERIDVPTLAASSGESLETAARLARYSFFAKTMKARGIKILATAHNADDNFETQLFNLCRGCGIDGLCGIPESRPFPEADGIIIRPILAASKQQIISYCAENGIEYVTDSTNFEDDCVRNKLRLNIIPQLKEIFTSPERAGARLAEYAKEDSEFLESEAKTLIDTFENGIDVAVLNGIHPSIAKRVIRMAFEDLSDEGLESVHIESVLDFAAEGKNGQISLPHKLCACFEDGILTFRPECAADIEPEAYSVSLPFGLTFIEGTCFAVSVSTSSDVTYPEGYMLYDTACVSAELSLSARNRREGDRIFTGGMHKRIKKLMCDKKVPSCDRSSLPLIFAGDELIFAPKCAISDIAKQKKQKQITISIFRKYI